MVPVSRELTINASSDFSNSFIVAIHLRCGRIFSDSFTAKFPTDCASERVFNLSIFDDDMNKSVVYLFSDSQCISPEKKTTLRNIQVTIFSKFAVVAREHCRVKATVQLAGT